MAYTFLLLAVFIIIAQVDGQDYCSICIDHTLCMYNSTSPACKEVIKIGVTNAEKADIVLEHNIYRLLVAIGLELRGNPGPQQPAANMKVLTWDDEIAKIAQMWVRQCMDKSDQCRNTNGTYVGQNLYMSRSSFSASTVNWPSTISAWYEEVPQFNRNNVASFVSTTSTDHYSALVWANTTKVGCGYIKYLDGTSYNHFYACNYSPGGNIIGTEMYKIGPACSACSGNCNFPYVGLCN